MRSHPVIKDEKVGAALRAAMMVCGEIAAGDSGSHFPIPFSKKIFERERCLNIVEGLAVHFSIGMNKKIEGFAFLLKGSW